MPLADPTTVGELYNKSMAQTSFAMVMIGTAGSITLMLVIVGLSGRHTLFHYSSHDVGYFAGRMLLGPRYCKTGDLDSTDIFGGDIEEAVERLVLVPIQAGDLIGFERGPVEGQAKFDEFCVMPEKTLNLGVRTGVH